VVLKVLAHTPAFMDHVDAEIDRSMNRGHGLVLVRRTVDWGHAHAAETDGGYFQFSQAAALHSSLLFSGH
jgi:hypothetical protein